MRLALLVPILALAASPAFADCAYLNDAGQSIYPMRDGSGFMFNGGQATPPMDCAITTPPPHVGWLDVDCGPWQGQMIIGPSSLTANDYGIIVFQKSFFYLVCD